MQKLERWGVACVVLGALLLLTGHLYPRLLPADRVWSPEDQEKRADAAGRFHRLSYEVAQAEGTKREQQVKQEMEKAKADYREYQDKLDRAREGPQRIKRILHWTGIVIASSGLFMVLLRRS